MSRVRITSCLCRQTFNNQLGWWVALTCSLCWFLWYKHPQRGRFQPPSTLPLSTSWGETFCNQLSKAGLVMPASTLLQFLRSPNDLRHKMEWPVVSWGKKNSRFVRKILAAYPSHSFNPKASTANVHGTQGESKFWKSHLVHCACISDDSRRGVERWNQHHVC